MQREGQRSEVRGQRSENPGIDARAAADRMLDELGTSMRRAEAMRANMQSELDEVSGRYASVLRILDMDVGIREKDLLGMAKAEREVLFGETDRVDLPHGSLVYLSEKWVVRAKGMLARLEALGKDDAIKVVKSVKWDVIEEWTDEQLTEAGTRREPRESYTYEVKDAQGRL